MHLFYNFIIHKKTNNKMYFELKNTSHKHFYIILDCIIYFSCTNNKIQITY